MAEHETAPDARRSSSAGRAILSHLVDGVATVTINRPEAMNSLDVATKDLLLATLQQVAEDPAVRCVVLTGTGRAFCVGQDVMSGNCTGGMCRGTEKLKNSRAIINIE